MNQLGERDEAIGKRKKSGGVYLMNRFVNRKRKSFLFIMAALALVASFVSGAILLHGGATKAYASDNVATSSAIPSASSSQPNFGPNVYIFSYSFFNQGVNIYAANAFEVPANLPPSSLHDLLTIFLDASAGKGGILNVINNTGGSSTIANPDVPVTVVSYP
jgi:hypothetical protein